MGSNPISPAIFLEGKPGWARTCLENSVTVETVGDRHRLPSAKRSGETVGRSSWHHR
ncbi:MAG: hypothetical protein GY731_13640 [Gammaproteobacteria bacterium]|nr:hypothetical protein [Gammaproteobacteria bacterium]